MSTKVQELRARILLESMERQLQDGDAAIPAETLNALLRISDHPLEYIMDFQPGNHPREVGKRILQLARERLLTVASATGGCDKGSSDDLKMMIRQMEIAIFHMERLNKRPSPSRPRNTAPGAIHALKARMGVR